MLRLIAILLMLAWAAPMVADSMFGVDTCSSDCSDDNDCPPSCQSCGCASHIPRLPSPLAGNLVTPLMVTDVSPAPLAHELCPRDVSRSIFHPPRAV